MDAEDSPEQPGTSPVRTWFEFLLDEDLLERHLAEENPGGRYWEYSTCCLDVPPRRLVM